MTPQNPKKWICVKMGTPIKIFFKTDSLKTICGFSEKDIKIFFFKNGLKIIKMTPKMIYWLNFLDFWKTKTVFILECPYLGGLNTVKSYLGPSFTICFCFFGHFGGHFDHFWDHFWKKNIFIYFSENPHIVILDTLSLIFLFFW